MDLESRIREGGLCVCGRAFKWWLFAQTKSQRRRKGAMARRLFELGSCHDVARDFFSARGGLVSRCAAPYSEQLTNIKKLCQQTYERCQQRQLSLVRASVSSVITYVARRSPVPERSPVLLRTSLRATRIPHERNCACRGLFR